MDDILNDDIDIDSAWSTFCEEGNIDNNYLNDLKETSKKDIPKASDIYISTKTKIAYLNDPIDLNTLFWKIDVIPYHKLEEVLLKNK